MPTPRTQKTARREPNMFEIGGKSVPFLLDFNSMCEIEEKLDKGIGQIAQEMGACLKVSTLRVVVVAGLSDRETVYSIEEAGEAINQNGIVPFAEAFAAAVEDSMGFSGALAKGLAQKPGKPGAS